MCAQLTRHSKLTLIDYVELASSFYASSSRNTHISFKSGLQRIEKVFKGNLETLQMHFISNPDKVVEKMTNANYSMNTVLNTLTQLSKVCTMLDLPAKYKKDINGLMYELKVIKDEETNQNQPTKEQQQQYKPWSVLVSLCLDKYEEFLDGDKSEMHYMQYMLLSMFLLDTPRRICNYLDMQYVPHCQDIRSYQAIKNKNFLLDFKGEMFYLFNSHKTAKYLGSTLHKVPVEVQGIMVNYLEKYRKIDPDSKKPDEFLLDRFGKKMTQRLVAEMLGAAAKKYLDPTVKYGVNEFRHIFISDFLAENPSISEKIGIAQEMLQTYKPQQQDKYNRRYK